MFQHRKRIIWLGVLTVLVVAYIFSLPDKLFTVPYSSVVQASNGELLSASIADDGQWRFPQTDSVTSKFSEALISFEDQRFFDHPGVDVLSMARALRQNIQAGKIVSGGSTITMQVIRLSRKESSRNIVEKLIEVVLATRLELRYSKQEILSMYAAHAPFGGNVVGIDAACWRYFGTSSERLSWSQAALLAVLPNSPALMHPGKNRAALKQKRDRLLERLFQAGKIDRFTCDLAKEETIPEQPVTLPRYARHLLGRLKMDGLNESKITSTIRYELQQRTEQILTDYHQRLKANQIFNVCAIVLEVETGNVLAYAGNVASGNHSADVDIIMSPRSTGSILKPFLYAAMIDEGKILPRTLLPDVPIFINGFAPRNFSYQYDGAVNADKALIRSLNVPAVHMLKEFRYEKFHTLLKNTGMTTLSQSPDHYGLSLILGGAEGTLWDIAGMYASMARTLNHFSDWPGKNRYNKKDFHAPAYIDKQTPETTDLEASSFISASSAYVTFDVLKELYRPGEESGWKYFSSAKKIAWKTGTSFGFRDAWAVGVTPEFVVGVWAGNADGEGRPGLTGVDAAAPVMFDIFSQLPATSWFDLPRTEMQAVVTCRQSGHRASGNCTETDTVMVSKAGLISSLCPYHQRLHLSKDKKFQVHSGCSDIASIRNESWFVLPPVQAYYFRSNNLSYKSPPPFRSDCQVNELAATMDMVYPKNNARIFIPRQIDGKSGSAVFELAHHDPATTVFWHLDGKYIGSTKRVHNIALNPGEGRHVLTAVDTEGSSIERHFEVISKM
jgi:penicillin-binding protein 1C